MWGKLYGRMVFVVLHTSLIMLKTAKKFIAWVIIVHLFTKTEYPSAICLCIAIAT